jgi:hypothetical protein
MTNEASEETLLSYVYDKRRTSFDDACADIAFNHQIPLPVYLAAEDLLGFGFGPPDVKNYLLEIEQDFAQEELV